MTDLKGKDLDDVLNGLFGRESPKQPAQTNNGGWKDIDVNLGSMIPRNTNWPLSGPGKEPNIAKMNPVKPQNSVPVVYLREGSKSYRKLEIESPMPVAIEVGPVNGMVGQEFEYCGIVKVYITEHHGRPVDFSRIDHSKIINLVMVKANFLGTFLVPESAVIKPQNEGQKLLKG